MMPVVALAVLLLGVSQTPPAADPAVVSKLLGQWDGQGVVTGRASEITMTWERAVGDAFVRLRFRNAMAAASGRPAEVFEAHGYYRVAAGTAGAATGTWVDARGYILPVQVTLAPDTFTSVWGNSTTEQGRTEYRLTGPDTLEVIDFVRTPTGEYREFGRSQLRRSQPGPA
jgi:hypothetical protein